MSMIDLWMVVLVGCTLVAGFSAGYARDSALGAKNWVDYHYYKGVELNCLAALVVECVAISIYLYVF